MKLYFTTPITMITAKAIYGNELESAHLVLDRSELTKGLRTVNFESSLLEYSSLLAKELNLSFSIISKHNFYKCSPDVIDVALINQKYLGTPEVILLPSDSYNCFFISRARRFFIARLKYTILWRRSLNYKSKNVFYYFNFVSKKIKRENLRTINSSEVNQLLREVSYLFQSEINRICSIKVNEEYALVMPPISRYTGESFTLKFLNEAKNIAKLSNLKMIIKPHPNDTFDYVEFGYVTNDIKTIPVEFFFSIKNIKQIISIPSSSLVFAEPDKLTVFIPQDTDFYHKNIIDQFSFLELIGIKPRNI
jgi:hypothetical protein